MIATNAHGKSIAAQGRQSPALGPSHCCDALSWNASAIARASECGRATASGGGERSNDDDGVHVHASLPVNGDGSGCERGSASGCERWKMNTAYDVELWWCPPLYEFWELCRGRWWSCLFAVFNLPAQSIRSQERTGLGSVREDTRACRCNQP